MKMVFWGLQVALYRCVFIDHNGRTIIAVHAEDALAALANARCRVAREGIYRRVEVWIDTGLVLASGPTGNADGIGLNLIQPVSPKA